MVLFFSTNVLHDLEQFISSHCIVLHLPWLSLKRVNVSLSLAFPFMIVPPDAPITIFGLSSQPLAHFCIVLSCIWKLHSCLISVIIYWMVVTLHCLLMASLGFLTYNNLSWFTCDSFKKLILLHHSELCLRSQSWSCSCLSVTVKQCQFHDHTRAWNKLLFLLGSTQHCSGWLTPWRELI